MVGKVSKPMVVEHESWQDDLPVVPVSEVVLRFFLWISNTIYLR